MLETHSLTTEFVATPYWGLTRLLVQDFCPDTRVMVMQTKTHETMELPGRSLEAWIKVR